MTEAEMERLCDALVWRRLATDGPYRNAENAEAQAEREDAITEQAWRELVARHGEPS
jgi:hypothetical protein